MKRYDYITTEDWNSLSKDQRISLRNGLRFMGFPVCDGWFPNRDLDGYNVLLDFYGNLISFKDDGVWSRDTFKRIHLKDVLLFIELTSFRVS